MIALVDSIAIGYDDGGTGLPIVFIHGFPHDRTLWTPQMQGLTARARCLAIDLRGFGETTAAAPFSMDQYADDVVGFMDQMRIDRAVVAGLSMGGYVALALWRRHPERVRALILSNTRAGADSPEAREKRRTLIELARNEGSPAIADSMITGMVGKTTRSNRPEIVNSVHRMISSAPVNGIVGALEAMMQRPDSTSTLPTIDVPTLVVTGDEDALIPVEEARSMHAAVRGSSLEVINGAGHLSNLERPSAFNHVVSEFLAALTLA
ncbi:MAG TPA: alpha/beta fold hydrolase [Gemmatimonadaceae bacterium]